ncbi:MAG: ABC transporter ATP-binding protein/permease [Treponema sp.]
MINKRLINLAPDSKKYIAQNIVFQWITLAVNIALVFALSDFLAKIFAGTAAAKDFTVTAAVFAVSAAVRIVFTALSTAASFHSAKTIKHSLRSLILKKMMKLGPSYNAHVSTAEVVQVAVEGCEQLETYFGAYLPQFFYSMIAPLTLFAVFLFVDVPSAVVLFVCVPLIPLTIAAVQTVAKKLFSKYWNRYADLGGAFLENLQGLTTLKIYGADEAKNREMNADAEQFRKITMRVLTMQLNSIIIMDFIAFGGAALGLIIAVLELKAGRVSVSEALAIILLSAEFFIPMRRLGSFFHVAMNGMAASARIFKLLDTPEPSSSGGKDFPCGSEIRFENVSFSYTGERDVLSGVTLTFAPLRVTAIVGESGSGKSTLASLLLGRLTGARGVIAAGSVPLEEVSFASRFTEITYVGAESYLFKGTVKENLLMGAADAVDSDLWDALEKVKLADFIRSQGGLEMRLLEKASNLSGGQRQRLALARALLRDGSVYIFDEATSNIDAQSENDIIDCIYSLAKTKTVILITHRLYNAKNAACIYALKHGKLAGSGTHEELLASGGAYGELWQTQNALETYGLERDGAR